jgi:hypothetical protein
VWGKKWVWVREECEGNFSGIACANPNEEGVPPAGEDDDSADGGYDFDVSALIV